MSQNHMSEVVIKIKIKYVIFLKDQCLIFKALYVDKKNESLVVSFNAAEKLWSKTWLNNQNATVHGYWKQHPQYGNQFQANKLILEIKLGSSTEANSDKIWIDQCTENLKGTGVGSKTIEKLMQKVGGGHHLKRMLECKEGIQEFKTMLDNTPTKVISNKRKLIIEEWMINKHAKWTNDSVVVAVSTLLKSKGIYYSNKQIQKICQVLGSNAATIMIESPEIIIDHNNNINDNNILSLLFSKNEYGLIKIKDLCILANAYQNRTKYLYLFILKVLEYHLVLDNADGHTCIDYTFFLDSLKKEMPQCQDLNFSTLKLIIDEMKSKKWIYFNQQYTKITTWYFYNLEQTISRIIIQKIGCVPNHVSLLNNQKQDIDYGTLNIEQVKAVQSAFNQRISFLTSLAGGGKTFSIRFIDSIAIKYDLNVLMCAPTGRAATRMHSISYTIHKLFASDKVRCTNGKLIDWRHDAHLIIFDESSMDTIEMAYLILISTSKNPNLHILFSGDGFQLPCIGHGNFYENCLYSLSPTSCVTELKTVQRQALSSDIVQVTSQIRNDKIVDWKQYMVTLDELKYQLSSNDPKFKNSGKVYFLNASSEGEVSQLIQNTNEFVYGIENYQNIMNLTPIKKTSYGTESINNYIQGLRFGNDAENECSQDDAECELKRFRQFHVGDMVIQQKNDYKKMVMNGMIGEIKKIYKSEEYENSVFLIVHFEEHGIIQPIEYEWMIEEEFNDFKLAYAITVHKSQGSEFPIVVLTWAGFLETNPFKLQMYNRHTLYTALTRAKRICIIISNVDFLTTSCKYEPEKNRNTMLAGFLIESINNRQNK